MVEKILEDFRHAYGLQYVILRYFNVAGADLDKECGERSQQPQNLIPLVLHAIRRGKVVEIFGSDYATQDGTAVRDYIHVVDLADAHLKSLDYLFKNNASIILNLGTGNGSSVKEVIEMASLVTGQSIRIQQAPKRPGDPAFLVADSSLARTLLGWEPQYSDLKTIVETEWEWIRSFDDVEKNSAQSERLGDRVDQLYPHQSHSALYQDVQPPQVLHSQ